MKSYSRTGDTSQTSGLTAPIPAVVTGLVTVVACWLLLRLFPRLPLEFFARGSAELAGLLSGHPVARVASGWLLTGTAQSVVVTAACSASDYFLIVTALISWQLARSGSSPVRATIAGFCAAAPLALAVNAVRVIAVIEAHRWLIPALPDAYGHFFHLLTGVSVFLPALIGLNLFLEFYGHSRLSHHSAE